MAEASTVKFVLNFADPELDADERENEAQRLLIQLRDLDEVESVERPPDPHPPAGNKAFGGFLAGALAANVKAVNLAPMLQFLGDRLSQKAVELEIEVDGRKLKLKAVGQQDLLSLLPVLQKFVAGTEAGENQLEDTFENPFENPFKNSFENSSENLFENPFENAFQTAFQSFHANALSNGSSIKQTPASGAIAPATRTLASPVSPTPRPVSVFFSYSHKDEDLRDEIATHLSLLKRQGLITAWHDREITAGAEWSGEIDAHLNTAQIILLLVSANFLASDYCYDVELTQAIARHERGEACVIPIILKPSDWTGAPFGKLQALPKNAKPITTWANRDEALLNVAQGIRTAVQRMAAQPD
ncbi:MAG: hypothetical protein OHK0037_38750 [Elainellaceae cyanobacterium]